MDIVQIDQSKRRFVEAVLGIRNDSKLTYAVTLDELFTRRENNLSCSFVNALLIDHEQELSVDKLYGILIALKEYQQTKSIPDYLISRIFRLIESRILIDEEEDHRWINVAFSILKKEYSFNRLKEFIELALAPYDIPSVYFPPYLDLLQVYSKNANDNEELRESFIREECEKLQQKYSDTDTGKQAYKKFLDVVCDNLKKSVIVHISEIGAAYHGLDKIKNSLDRKSDLGIRGLIIFWILAYICITVFLVFKFDWNQLEPVFVVIGTLVFILPCLYFVFTEKTLKPQVIYDSTKEKVRNRLYKWFNFDLNLYCNLKENVEKFGPD